MKRYIHACLAILALTLVSPALQAAIFNVTRTDDPAPNGCNSNIDCSLREAVIAANALGEPSTINVPAGTYLLTRNGADDNADKGDLDIAKFITITGASAVNTIVDASSLGDRPFAITSGPSELTLNNLTLRGGDVTGTGVPSGGAVYVTGGNLIVNNCLFTGNTADAGGAIYLVGARDAEISNSTFLENDAVGNQPVEGGGAIYANIDSQVILNNSTISGNQSAGFGGGINTTEGDLIVRSSTIAENNADQMGGGIFLNDGAGGSTLNIANSILALNTVGSGSRDCSKDPMSTATSPGYNIFGGVSDCAIALGPDDHPDVADPGLMPLANYGGQTPTYLPEPGSIAIDNGDPTGCDDGSGDPLTTDQRGQNRESGVACDSGADELGESDLSIAKTQDANAIQLGGILTYTVNVTNNGPDSNFNIALTDDLPSEVLFNSVTTDDDTDLCSQDSGVVSCSLGQLDSGESAVVTISVTISVIPVGGTATNTASVQGTEIDPNPDNETTSIITRISGPGGCSLQGNENPTATGLLFSLILSGLGLRTYRNRHNSAEPGS